MTQMTDAQPDRLDAQAPDPRTQYDSPESLAEDITIDLQQREMLLLEWKYDLEQRLAAISEGMDSSTPDGIPDQSDLSAQLRRVTEAWDGVAAQVKLSAQS